MHCLSRRAPGRPSNRWLAAVLSALAVATVMIALGGPSRPAGESGAGPTTASDGLGDAARQ